MENIYNNKAQCTCFKLLIVMWLFGIGSICHAQKISGRVYFSDSIGNTKAASGAEIHFAGSANRTIADINGQFSILKESKDSLYLLTSYMDFLTDSTLIPGDFANTDLVISLKKKVQIEEVQIKANQPGTSILKFRVLKTEQISSGGLVKMACCNLSESFENSATVTVGFSDAVSGAKQVQLLGLSSNYTQMLAENIPTLRGLATTYGWSFTPGSWLESIQLSKGASSVVNGYEAIAGQINLEFKKPNNTNPLFLNLYADEFNCYEANITSAIQISENLWTGLLLSGTLDNKPHDYNGDNFLDMPQLKFVNVYNRWFYLSPKGVQSRTGIKYLYEDRIGGEDPFHKKIVGAGAHYTSDIQNRNITVENKTGFPVGAKEGQSIGIINSVTYHEQNSSFGLKSFNGTQSTFYSNILFTSYIGSKTSNKYTLGGSFVFDNYNTQYQDLLPFNLTPLIELNRQELISGLFGEYTYSNSEKLTLILGARTDYNSKYGWLFTPRANVKYNISDYIIARGSIGKGYRAPNVIADNIGIMASSRKLYVDGIPGLGIESAWNYGGNLTFYIPDWDKHKFTFSLDYFHTEFQNQAIIDIERNSNSVFFYNLKGRSYADAWQADLSFTPFNRFDVFAAFRYNITEITYSDGNQSYLVEKPLTSRYRGLVNMSYATKFKKWVFDFTTQLNGPSRIPCLNGYNSELKESPFFPIYFAQVTKNTKRFDIYIGAENILDFKQNNPIIGASNPFDQGFESSFVWGPIVGRKIYAGIRLRIGKLV